MRMVEQHTPSPKKQLLAQKKIKKSNKTIDQPVLAPIKQVYNGHQKHKTKVDPD